MRDDRVDELLECSLSHSVKGASSPSQAISGNADGPAFVLVHGAWHGGWCWARVARELQMRGHRVYTPTLTGVGDRSHMLSPAIGLEHHIQDVVNLIRWEGLDSVVLCGHSYGGMVITGVVERLASAPKAIVYLDAFLPKSGEALVDILGDEVWSNLKSHLVVDERGGISAPPASMFVVNAKDESWVDMQCTPHPLATFLDSLPSTAAHEQVRRKVYVLAGAYGPPSLVAIAEARRNRSDWLVYELPFGHDLMLDAPMQVTDILLEAAGERLNSA
nr:alpha/beta hydrolase [Burkholderia cepacia]